VNAAVVLAVRRANLHSSLSITVILNRYSFDLVKVIIVFILFVRVFFVFLSFDHGTCCEGGVDLLSDRMSLASELSHWLSLDIAHVAVAHRLVILQPHHPHHTKKNRLLKKYRRSPRKIFLKLLYTC
jgi:hypothetical protein